MKHTLKSNYKDIIKTTISIEVDKNTDMDTQKEILLDFYNLAEKYGPALLMTKVDDYEDGSSASKI